MSPNNKNSYEGLTQALKKRFTPVRIQGVVTSLFHGRKQKNEESVDNYAQELRRLYQRAYPESFQGSVDAERMGKTLLASQFVSGLRSEIKKGVTSSNQSCNIEQLLVKARFEEAKLAELTDTGPSSKPLRGTENSTSHPSSQRVRFQSPIGPTNKYLQKQNTILPELPSNPPRQTKKPPAWSVDLPQLWWCRSFC